MFQISKQSDYGLIILSYLWNKNETISLTELIESTKLPQRFLARIAATLVKHHVLTSKEGRIGGYQLNKKTKSLSAYDFLRIFEGDMKIAECCSKTYCCEFDHVCSHKNVLKHLLTQTLICELKKIKLRTLLGKLPISKS